MKTPEKRYILYKLWNISKNKAPIGKRRYGFGEKACMYHYQKEKFLQQVIDFGCLSTQQKKEKVYICFQFRVITHFKKKLWFNTRWLCYSVWGKTHVFHNSGFNSETILPISIFLFDELVMLSSHDNNLVCPDEDGFLSSKIYFIFPLLV